MAAYCHRNTGNLIPRVTKKYTGNISNALRIGLTINACKDEILKLGTIQLKDMGSLVNPWQN